MRKSTTVSSLTLVVLLLLSLIAAGSAWKGRMVGGRTEVKDVKSNKEIQELGRFSVEQYNNNLEEDVSHFRLQQLHGAGRELKFVEVVKAETQVVSGIKYYLTVEVKEKESGDATVKEEKTRVFEAQVVVQPWLQSKKLLKFAPSHK